LREFDKPADLEGVPFEGLHHAMKGVLPNLQKAESL
jgi:hypothetical protein